MRLSKLQKSFFVIAFSCFSAVDRINGRKLLYPARAEIAEKYDCRSRQCRCTDIDQKMIPTGNHDLLRHTANHHLTKGEAQPKSDQRTNQRNGKIFRGSI